MHSQRVVFALLAVLQTTCAMEYYDYVIVGAGTSGLTLANRLSEDPKTTVAVIDPGQNQQDNAEVKNPASWLGITDASTRWGYKSTPQANVSGRMMELAAGKGIGGTSLINGMTYIRGDKAQFDSWEKLGNPGWNWDALLPHYKKVEKLFLPEPSQVEVGATIEPQFHGIKGEVHVGFIPGLQEGPLYRSVQETWEKLGQGINEDANSGVTKGFTVWPQTLDPEQNIRYDAATAFLWPISERENLKLINGTALRVLWDSDGPDDSGKMKARGVEYLSNPDGKQLTIFSTKEVILSAGSLRTPLILERSGVGSPKILESKGIKPLINLPGVGENLIDQPNTALIYASNTPQNGYSPYATFVTAKDLFGTDFSKIATEVEGKLDEWANQVACASNAGLDTSAVRQAFGIQYDLMFREGVTIAEILTTAQDTRLASAYWILLPFSRGSVHIKSTNLEDLNNPIINPKYFSINFDMETQEKVGRLCADFWSTSPINAIVAGQLLPNSSTLPPDATSAQWTGFVRSAVLSNSHYLGTAAMMARELGGVVDSSLKVYGTNNLRVVDASVLPTQFSGHLTATLYAVADRASEWIKQA